MGRIFPEECLGIWRLCLGNSNGNFKTNPCVKIAVAVSTAVKDLTGKNHASGGITYIPRYDGVISKVGILGDYRESR